MGISGIAGAHRSQCRVEGAGVEDEAVADGVAVEGGDAADVEFARGAEQPAPLHPGVEAGHQVGVEAVQGLGRAAGLDEVFREGLDAGAVFGDLVATAGAVELSLPLDDPVEVFEDADAAVDGGVGGVDLPEGVAEDVGGAVELALERGVVAEEALLGVGVTVAERGEVAGGDGAEGLGDGKLALAVGHGHHHCILRYGYEAKK